MTTPWARLFGHRSNHKSDDISTIDLLSRVPLFEDLNRRELVAVERILHRRQYLRGEMIFRQGERGMGMYIVQQGMVAITKRDKARAVLLSMEEYQALLERSPDPLKILTAEFDALVARMQTPVAKAAGRALFKATPAELGKAAVSAVRKRG